MFSAPVSDTMLAMSKHLLSIFLSELQTIRIHCASSACGGVVEFPTAQLAALKSGPTSCPVCGAPFRLENSALISLGQNLTALEKAKFDVEFVLPAD